MAHSYNINEVPSSEGPSLSYEIRKAKEYLQTHNSESGDSLYDHLSELLSKILSERPKNALDAFEEYSKKLKEEKFKSKTDHLQNVYVPPLQYERAKKLIKLFEVSPEQEENNLIREEEEESGFRREKVNLLELFFFIEDSNVGLPRSEVVILNLSIQKLISEAEIENARYWGKILGSQKNYHILEADLKKEELTRRQEKIAAEEESQKEKESSEAAEATKISEEEVAANTQREATEEEALDAALKTELPREGKPAEKGLELIFPALPQNLWKPPARVPPEPIGTGLNQKVYFVCNSPGLDDWVELPMVTPQQIVASRSIIKMFTGNLETEIFTFPPFPGNEANYLRSQIARISASTLISPVGYFTFGGEEDEEEEEEIEEEEQTNDGAISKNPHYDPLPVKELIDPSMSNWCHHSPFILKQGRAVPWNPKESEIDEEEAEEEEEEEDAEEEMQTIEKEVGPPLLTPLSEDATLESIVPWSTRLSSRVQKDASIAIVRSNIWPGAFAFASGKRLVNLYIGFGTKYYAHNYMPPSMPQVQDQYEIGPEVIEMTDPSFQEEEAYRIAHLPPSPKEASDEEESEDDVEDDDNDDDNDDDDDDDDDD